MIPERIGEYTYISENGREKWRDRTDTAKSQSSVRRSFRRQRTHLQIRCVPHSFRVLLSAQTHVTDSLLLAARCHSSPRCHSRATHSYIKICKYIVFLKLVERICLILIHENRKNLGEKVVTCKSSSIEKSTAQQRAQPPSRHSIDGQLVQRASRDSQRPQRPLAQHSQERVPPSLSHLPCVQKPCFRFLGSVVCSI